MGGPVPSIKKRYPGRHDDAMPVNLTLTRAAVGLLRELAPHGKSHGQFVSQLILDYHERKGFKNFFEEESARQLKRLCKLVRKDTRRADGV